MKLIPTFQYLQQEPEYSWSKDIWLNFNTEWDYVINFELNIIDRDRVDVPLNEDNVLERVKYYETA